MIVLFFLFRQYKRMKKKTTVIPVTTAIDANKKGTDKSHLLNVSGKNKNILKDGNTSKNTNIKRIHFDDDFSLRSFFSGRTIDPVTGKLYEYNKKTQERRWVTK
ncbi:cadherin-related family member 3-like [Octopus bimaculoides]|uniref:cadherin-related family member 3-like n=1 Tax=Octopus bimaculoides TaxID=37653 RepID=UPI0022DF13C3|nr:cadherin-related family member 3-like [Octopus bimaculoides]